MTAAATISPPCPHCQAIATKPDGAGGFDCDDCGYWFTPGITESDPDSLNLKLYIAQHYPRVEDQLEARGFDEWIYGIWRLNVEPSWMFDVTYYEKDAVWNFRITWMTEFALIHFENFKNAAALMFDIDSSLRKYQGKRYVATAGDDIVVENAASMPLAYGLMEDDSDFYQPALPFDPAINLGQATQRKLPYDPPLERSYAPAPDKWTPPPKVYKQDPDDIDPWEYINAAPNMGERRIRVSFRKITWHDPPDEDYDEEHGWEDEEGVDLTVDKFDDEGTTPVDKAAKFLRDKGAQDTGNDDWYDSEPQQNYRDGSDTTYSYHLVGYTEEELAAIYDRIVTNRRRWRQESADPDDPMSMLSTMPSQFFKVRMRTDERWKWLYSMDGHDWSSNEGMATTYPAGLARDIAQSAQGKYPDDEIELVRAPNYVPPLGEAADPDDPDAFIRDRMYQRCPKCGSESVSKFGLNRIVDKPLGGWRTNCRCEKCKHVFDLISEAADPDDPDAFMTRFYRGKPIKKVEVYGRRWWCRGPGNTYHSVQILVDGQHVATIDFVYGGGDQYMWTARDWLSRNGYLMAHDHHEALWRIAEKQGFQFIQDVMDVKRKRDL